MTDDPKPGNADADGDASPGPSSHADGDLGFDEVLAEHLLAAEAGAAPDREAFIRRHPQWAAELKAFFADQSQVQRLAGLNPYPDPTAAFEQAGATVGRYKLLERIGEGGFGVVFMAEQTHPVRRKVALKAIKPGMDTKQVIARFEAERQALALMEHPNIATVLDAGTTESGRPYFVMDLVPGIPITDYCDRNRLSPRARLELFVQVCQAVQHAHQKGIIHRDLKPTNVLVAVHDDRPVPKVIDFGIAKAAGSQLSETTLFTPFAQLVGTPLYMSPEQAQMGGLDVDTRSDVYSLGVLLYELLTSCTPFDRRRLGLAALDEVRRIIREEEPPKPSTRLSASDQLPSIASNRGLDPKKLSGLVRGDLDWIVMKCLEKDRGRRYETANGLARDVERYLADKPVQACPPSAAYRLRKFVRRHRGPVIAAAMVTLTVSGGIAGTAWQAVRADRERAKVAQERVEKLTARKAEIAARGSESEYLKRILEHYESLAALTGDTRESRALRAEGHARIGILRFKLGEFEVARASYERAITLFRQLAVDFPDAADYRAKLAENHNNLGVLLTNVGNHTEAEGQYRQALVLKEKLVTDFPAAPTYQISLAASHRNVGLLFVDLGKSVEAERQYRQALVLQEKLVADFPAARDYLYHLAASHNDLALLLREMRKPAESEAEQRQALAIQERLAAVQRYGAAHPRAQGWNDLPNPEPLGYRGAWIEIASRIVPEHEALSWIETADRQARPNDFDEQVALAQASIVLANSTRTEVHRERAAAMVHALFSRMLESADTTSSDLVNLGVLCEGAGDPAMAEWAYRLAINKNPAEAVALNNLAMLLTGRGETLQAETLAARAAAAEHPRRASFFDTLATVHETAGQWPRAIDSMRKAIDLDPQNMGFQIHHAEILSAGGDSVARRSARDAVDGIRPEDPRLTSKDRERLKNVRARADQEP